MSDTWQLQEAKSKFSELVDRALKNGAQVVTRHGKRVVVIIPYSDYEKMTAPKENLAEFLLNSPLAGTELEIKRDHSLPRAIEIEA